MLQKSIKTICSALIIAVLGAILFMPRPALADTGDPVGCGTWNEWYGIFGTQHASGAYIGPVTLSMGSSCQWEVVLKFFVDGQLVYFPEKSYGEYYIIKSGGAHTITFFFDTGGDGQSYGPFFIAINVDKPPTITANVACSQWGQNGWCNGSETLDLTASDPQGKAVLISGNIGNEAFACPSGDTTCTISLPNGTSTITYLVTSQTTLTASGTTSWSLDSDSPQISGALNGSSGMGNWFISNVLLSASASDATSGVSLLEYSYDGVTWSLYTTDITLLDGQYTITVRATDNAGNQNEVSQSVHVDTLTPNLNLAISGTTGLNGWYKSHVQVTASGDDSGSGLASIEYSVDGGAWASYTSALTFIDGVHSLSVRATDAAGNITQTDQQIRVDTITPLINLSVLGTQGISNWYTSDIKVNASGQDGGSGLASFDYSLTDGIWSAYATALPYADGQRNLKFRAIDQAGNITLTPTQLFSVDKTPPVIKMSNAWTVGSTEKYKTYDDLSGIAGVHVAIQDDQERYPKVTWDDGELGMSFDGEIFWDGRFADGTVAPSGDYFVTLTAYDQAGNENMQTAIINVANSLLTYLIPPSAPVIHPSTALPTLPLPSNTSIFGGETNTDPDDSQSGSISSGGVLTNSAGTVESTSFNENSSSSNNQPVSSSQTNNILWGALAAAAVGVFTAEALAARRKEQEDAKEALVALLKKQQAEAEATEAAELAEKAAKQAARFAGDESTGMTYKQIGQAFQASLQAFKENLVNAGLSEVQATAYVSQAITNGSIPSVEAVKQKEKERQEFLAKNEDEIALDIEKVNQLVDEANTQNAQLADSARWTELAVQEQAKQDEEKNWLEKVWDSAFKNQTELSLGTGILAGLAAVALVVTGVITAPAWLVIGGAVLATAAIVTAGTLALNAHFELGLGANLGGNLLAGTAAAILTAGAGLLLASAAPWVSASIASTCANYPNACSQIGTIVDYGEEALLSGQVAYYTWVGDQDKAAEAMLQLQLEQLDGGVPGNSVATEVGEQLSKLGDDVPELIATYGDEIVPLLLQYGDDAVDIIGAYGDDGIALLLRFGDKTDDAIALVKEFGTPAAKVLDAVDLTSAKTLLTTLNASSLEYAIKQGPEAVKALSYWPDSYLIKYGDELILRAKDDARALEAASKLVKLKDLNTKEAQDLIDTIAYNSIQGGGNRLVLGKWVNNGTLDNGFIGVARADGALFYGTNPGLAKIFSGSTDLPQQDLFWAVNNRVLEISVAHDFKIDYSLDGIDRDSIRREITAIKAIASKKSQEDVAKIMGGSFPFRFKEVKVLVDQGYIFEIDKAANVIHWIKP